VRGEEDVGLGVGGRYREDVPGVGGDDVGGDEIDVGGGVGVSVGVEVAFVGVAATAEGGLDLDAVEVSAMLDGKVVGSVISPGLGDAEREFGGAGHEEKLGPFASGFGVTDVRGSHTCSGLDLEVLQTRD